MMQRKPLSDQHCVKLAEYGLQAIPLDSCVCLKFHAGETILQEGMPITYLFVVVSGSAKVCSTARNGKNLVSCCFDCTCFVYVYMSGRCTYGTLIGS